MIYRVENGRYEAVKGDGEIITFDGAAEMIECAEMRVAIFELIGRPIKNMDEFKRLFNPCEPITKIETKKKKIRISIDPDVQYIGKEKALA